MKKIQIILILGLLTPLSILVFFSAFAKAEIPYLKISTEVFGIYILFFVMKLYVNLRLDSKDLLWAVSSIYVISFLISIQELIIHGNDLAISFISSVFIALGGVILSGLLCLIREHLRKTF